MKLLVKMVFGSHLYGTSTEHSDTDFKGVYLPTKEEVYLGKIPKSIQISKGNDGTKNSKDDVDYEVYSLHYFLKLACEGQTVALDMLHADPRHWLEASPLWEELATKRREFYTANLSAFVGYARTQAAKYGIKGSRLDAAKQARDCLAMFAETKCVGDKEVWAELWEDEYCHFLDNGVHRIWQVCGKGISETAKCGLARQMLDAFIERYGARARLAEANQGIDWKAVSHALRAGYQARLILSGQELQFPLPEVDFLRAVKAGRLDYLTAVAPQLEALMDELEILKRQSVLPNAVNRHAIDQWLVEKLDEAFLDQMFLMRMG